MSPLSSGSKAEQELRLSPAFTPVSYFPHSSILKREAISSSETSLDFQPTTRGNNSRDRALQNVEVQNISDVTTFQDPALTVIMLFLPHKFDGRVLTFLITIS